MPLSRLLDKICSLRDALHDREGKRKQRTLHELRTHLALALVMSDTEARDLDGSAAVNVEVLDERDEARVSFTVDLSTDSEFEFPVSN